MYGGFKIRAVPININFRYVRTSCAYLFDNADLAPFVYDRGVRAADRGASATRSPTLRHLVDIDDGTDTDLGGLDSVPYDEALPRRQPIGTSLARTPDDLYILYTGGTTGMPEGGHVAPGGRVLRPRWRHRRADRSPRHARPRAGRQAAASGAPVMFSPPPLMHGAAQWAVMGRGFVGATARC